MSVTHIHGMDPEESPLPEPELALGNVVRLKNPFVADRGTKYRYGIIVEHVGHNAFGVPMVSLHVYDDQGKLHLIKGSHLPHYVDFAANDLILLAIARTSQVFPDGFELYPLCDVCKDVNQHPFGKNPCEACGGWGFQKSMRRVPPA